MEGSQYIDKQQTALDSADANAIEVRESCQGAYLNRGKSIVYPKIDKIEKNCCLLRKKGRDERMKRVEAKQKNEEKALQK